MYKCVGTDVMQFKETMKVDVCYSDTFSFHPFHVGYETHKLWEMIGKSNSVPLAICLINFGAHVNM